MNCCEKSSQVSPKLPDPLFDLIMNPDLA